MTNKQIVELMKKSQGFLYLEHDYDRGMYNAFEFVLSLLEERDAEFVHRKIDNG